MLTIDERIKSSSCHFSFFSLPQSFAILERERMCNRVKGSKLMINCLLCLPDTGDINDSFSHADHHNPPSRW